MISLEDLRGRTTLSVPEAGQLLGLGRDSAYAAVERGELTALRVGRRLVCPTYVVLHSLGWPDELIARTLGIDLDAPAPEHTDGAPGTGTPPATVHVLAQKTGDPVHGAPDAS